MAIETLSISRPESPQASLDYDKLFKEGIEHIEALSGRLWTDFNAHDPGITIMELLCYAITELGYRCDFPIGDIVEPQPGSGAVSNDFFSLAEIASNAPLTVNDFRKLLIDLPGIRNAWLEKASTGEVPVFFDGSVPILRTYQAGTWTEVEIKGLYKVYVQFEEDKDFGDLNDNSMMTEVTLDLVTGPTPFEMEIEFPIWEEISEEIDMLETADIVAGMVELKAGTFLDPDITGEEDTYRFTLVVNPSGRVVELPVTLRVISGQENVLNFDDFDNNLEGQLDGSIASTWVLELIQRFMEKRALTLTLLDDVRSYLGEHRNLCEDFVAIYPMSLQEIGLHLKLDVVPGSDMEEIMAEAYRRMEEYLSPVIRFYSLREMLEKGYEADQIFRGTILNNGFIDEQELSFHQRREVLYTSDLIQEFMKIPGVESVRYIALSRYLVGNLQESNRTECLRLTSPQQFLPRLNYNRSVVEMDDGSGRFKEPDRPTALDLLREKKALDQIKGTTVENDFPLPEGTYRGLDKYHSIQHEFPINYALGTEGLAPTETDLRKAQAKQLKAYLLFFEQMLADFLTQLSEIRRLFSYREDIDRTYYTQALWQVPRVQDLIADFTTSGATWQDYIDLVAPTPTHYRIVLDEIAESEETFHDRRHRFLNHLMGRFNESFTAYAAYIFSRNHTDAEKYSRLIGDQVRFLRKYDEHSHDRGTSFNYQALLDGLNGPDFWNSDRVTGLKKRMVYHTGLPTVDREYISPLHHFEVFQNAGLNYRYRLTEEGNSTIMLVLNNSRAFATEEELWCEVEKVMEHGLNPDNYDLGSSPVRLMHDGVALGDIPVAYVNAHGAAVARDRVIERLEKFAEIENFHVIEHVILRPRESGFPTLAVRTVADCPQLDIRDPYSFRISVVLPTWAGRFKDVDFHRLFKRIMRMETPAHVYIHFNWIDRKQMYHFETCWADWLNGEWIPSDSLLLQEAHDEGVTDARTLQENAYFLLLDREASYGEDGKAFVHCLSKLKNLKDSYYIMEPARIVDQYQNDDLLGEPVDPDSVIIRAWLSDTSGPLPPGTCLDPCTGRICVTDASLLQDAADQYPVEIFTMSASGELTCHSVVIEFIPNGPAVIKVGPLNQHEAKYALNDVVLEFEDPDGAIIQATLTSGTIPAGMTMDPLTGTITVTNPAALVPSLVGNPVSFKLMDEVGGVTLLSTVIQVIPDTEAVASIQYDVSQNQDAFQTSDVLFHVTDIDDGVANLAPRGGQLPLANYGLAVVYTGSPQRAEIVVQDAAVLQSALTTFFILNGTHYETTLRLTSTDGCGGTTGLDIVVRIYRDNTPTVDYGPVDNRDQYTSGRLIATIRDNPDNGIAQVSPSVPLAPLGMGLAVVGNKAELTVTNQAAFSTALDNDFAFNGTSFIYSFQVGTVDNTGGLALVTLLVEVLPDQEPTVWVRPPQNQDTYFYLLHMARITDADGLGVLSMTESASTPQPLAGTGLSLGTYWDNGLSAYRGRIYISNYPQFQNAVENGPFVEVDPVTKLRELTVHVDVVDYTGGLGQCIVTMGVIKDMDGTVLEVTNRQRVDAYVNGDVLIRIADDDPNAPNAGLTLLGTTPTFNIPGLAIRTLSSGEIEVYVQNAANLSPVKQTINFRVQDSTGGQTTHPIEIEIKPRFLSFTEVVSYNGGLASVPLQGNYPMVSVITSSPPTTFGTLFLAGGGLIYFSMGTGFPTSTGPGVFNFIGTSNGQPVEGELIVTRQSISIGGGVIGTTPDLGFGLVGARLSGGAGDPILEGLANDTQNLLNNVNGAKNYEDNPLLQTNPELMGDYAAGRKDNYVTDELGRLTEATADKIVQLQNEVIRKEGDQAKAARQELESYSVLYEQQLRTAIEYAGSVRDGDLAEEGKVQELFDNIQRQLGRFK